jgi:hypothetical protein
LHLLGAIVFSLAYTLTLSLVARHHAGTIPALNIVDRVVVFVICALQLSFSILYTVRQYRFGLVRCTIEMRACILQSIAVFITMNLVGNVARTVSETGSTTIVILFVSGLVWQWFWIFGFYWHAMAILRLYRDIRDRTTFLRRNRTVLMMCFLIAAMETAFCSWSGTALGLTWPSMLVQYIERRQYQEVAYSVTFGLVVVARLFLDGWIAYELYRTFRVLLNLPYTCGHHKQMGARFFRVVTAISYIFLLTSDTIAAGLVPLPAGSAFTHGVRIHLLGIARFNGGTYAVLFIWSTLLLYAHLPPTVSGIWSPWIVALIPDPAAYQRRQADAARLQYGREHSSLSSSLCRPWTPQEVDDEQELRKVNLYYQSEAEAITSGEHWLSRSLVLETHILFFNLAYLSYRPWRDPKLYAELFDHYGVGEKHSLKARLVRHISSSVTDVHVLVIELADRIVVSFRGTKSTRNWRTDVNVRRVRLDEHLHARECPDMTDAWHRRACSKHCRSTALPYVENSTHPSSDPSSLADHTDHGLVPAPCTSGTTGKVHGSADRVDMDAIDAKGFDLEEGPQTAESTMFQRLGRRWWWHLRSIMPLRLGDMRSQAGEDFSRLVGRHVPMMVHDGFMHAYLSVREELVDVLTPLADKPIMISPIDEHTETSFAGAWSGVSENSSQSSSSGAQDRREAVALSAPSDRSDHQPVESGHPAGPRLQRANSVSTPDERTESTASDLSSRKHKPVIFCGHSLGGALATIAALDLTSFENAQSLRLSSDRVMVVTFGSPRVGNHSFCSAYRRHVPFSFRWAAVGDIVTKLPFWGYEHVPVKVMLDPLSGSILIDPSIIEEAMVAFRNSVDAHLRSAYTQGLQRWCRRYHPRWKVLFWDFHDVFDEHALGAALESIT